MITSRITQFSLIFLYIQNILSPVACSMSLCVSSTKYNWIYCSVIWLIQSCLLVNNNKPIFATIFLIFILNNFMSSTILVVPATFQPKLECADIVAIFLVNQKNSFDVGSLYWCSSASKVGNVEVESYHGLLLQIQCIKAQQHKSLCCWIYSRNKYLRLFSNISSWPGFIKDTEQ